MTFTRRDGRGGSVRFVLEGFPRTHVDGRVANVSACQTSNVRARSTQLNTRQIPRPLRTLDSLLGRPGTLEPYQD